MTMRISANRIDMDDKTLQKPVLKDYGETVVTADSSTAYTCDLTEGNVFDITLTGNCSFTFANPPTSGTVGSFTLYLTQDATGGRAVTWPAAVTWLGGSAPTLYIGSGSVKVILFFTVDGGTTWYGSTGGGINHAPFSLSFVEGEELSGGSDTYTMSDASFGAEVSDPNTRYVIVAAYGRFGLGFTSAEIGDDSSPTIVESITGSSDIHAALIIGQPSGTSGDITVNLGNDSNDRVMLGVLRMVNAGSASAYATSSDDHTSGECDLSLNIPTGGAAIAMVSTSGAANPTWTGATEVYEFDFFTDDYISIATTQTVGTPKTITVSSATTDPSGMAGCAASWGPV